VTVPVRRPVSGETRLAAVIGSPIRHSLSPAIYNAAFAEAGLDWVFLAFEVSADAVPGAFSGMQSLGIEGLSVTMPCKEAAAAAVDECTDVAARLGAVNSVRLDGGRLVGHNTDGAGFVDSLRLDAGVDPAGSRCVVLGAGGAARAVILALAEAGAREVVVVARNPERAERAAALAGPAGGVGPSESVASADLVVNATPIGMAGDPGLPLDPALLRAGQVVADLVYHPLETPLLATARSQGATAHGGLGMLVHQAGHQFTGWTGVEAPLAAMQAAVRSALDS
jgi:shikimate dehydrogenase